MLRDNRCDLLITPVPPAGIEIVQKRLLQDHYVCYYDPAMRAPPPPVRTIWQRGHITVVYTDNERLDFDRRLGAQGIARDIAISVPSFTGVPAFLRGSTLLASMPSLFGGHLMRDFASVRLPLPGGAGRWRRCRCTWSGTSASRRTGAQLAARQLEAGVAADVGARRAGRPPVNNRAGTRDCPKSARGVPKQRASARVPHRAHSADCSACSWT